MGSTAHFFKVLLQWYQNNFWNLYTESSNHTLRVGYFYVRTQIQNTFSKKLQKKVANSKKSLKKRSQKLAFYQTEIATELHKIWTQPVNQAAYKAYLARKKRALSNKKKLHKKLATILKKNIHRSLPKPVRKSVNKSVTVFTKRNHRLKSICISILKSGTQFFSFLYKILTSYPAQLALSLLYILIGIYGSGQAVYVFAFQDLPPVTDLVERRQHMTTRILDRNGNLLFRIYEDENRTLIKLNELPSHVIQATIAIEDKDYYSHPGFSVAGITRAFIANAQNETVQGGSTITQQLVKNRLLTPEKTFKRKARELILAIRVNQTYSKDEVLEMYLNQVAYGGATYGIEEAAQLYFGKSATDLTLGEASMLAGLPQSPSVYSPFGSRPELAYLRQEEVLRRMVEDGYISAQEAETARSEVLQFRPNRIDIFAPHFVMYVRELLALQYGDAVINQEGLEVITTLDLDLQNEVQSLVTAEVESLKNLRVSNGAALVTAPATGEILAMVGSTNYFDFEKDGQVNVTLRPRQPGSSIKPITYALALSQGKTPNSVIDDSPITYQTVGSPPYSPRNYDGRFRGRVSLRESLASSYNIPAVKLLAEHGIEPMITLAEKMGISTWTDRSRFGLSLTLGGGEVLMTDMAEVYGTFANRGQTIELNPILEIKNAWGEQLYRNSCALDGYGCNQSRSLDPRVAYQITDILSDNRARTPAFGPQSVLSIPGQEVAVKTGTTNNLRDNWTFGYTSDYVVASWVGNNDNTPMSYIASGITGASPLWNKIMRSLLDENNPHIFPTPDGMITVPICLQTGTLACKECPTIVTELYIPGTEPTTACSASSFRPKKEPADL